VSTSEAFAATLAVLAGLFGVDALHALEQVTAVGALDVGADGAAVVAFLLERVDRTRGPCGAIVICHWHCRIPPPAFALPAR